MFIIGGLLSLLDMGGNENSSSLAPFSRGKMGGKQQKIEKVELCV